MYVKESSMAKTSLALQKTFRKNGENTLLVSLAMYRKIEPRLYQESASYQASLLIMDIDNNNVVQK
jgi:hypothetical protein